MAEESQNNQPLQKQPGALAKWFSALLGRSVPKTQPLPGESPRVSEVAADKAEPKHPELTQQDNVQPVDSITADMQSVKKVFSKVADKISKSSTPVIAKGKQGSSQLATHAQKALDTGKIKKLTTVFIGIILLLLLVFFVSRLFGNKLVQNNGNQNAEEPVPSYISPTPFDYQVFVESIYARDKDILRLEENLEVLDAEVANFQLKESSLTSPALDFNISF